MNETHDERKITLTFDGGATGGRVPLTVLAGKLQALQSLLFHAAATVEHSRIARRGQWANRYREAVELEFVDAHHSNLTIEASLSEPQPDLFGGVDLGAEAVDLTYDVAAALQQRDYGALSKRVGDRQERMLLMRQFEALAPRVDDTFALTLANGSAGHSAIRLTGQTRLMAQYLTLKDQVDEVGDLEEVRLVGTLTKIHYDVAPEMLSVRVTKGHEVKCYYDASLRDQVANLCAGSIVEVGGFGTPFRNGELKQVDLVTDLDAVSMEPIRIQRFEHGNATYKLREPLTFTIEFMDGVWIYSNERYRLWGYAKRREDALIELAEAFDYLYREIALEEDDLLDGKAVDTKRRLLAIVEQAAEPGGGAS